ncbi:unnamed protein product [Mytilus coruscus]|uniref:Reverse transcriptase domain-containing protein n=1 Tax=Mytilus coruscus TaxID=42192 RepID=A0A6J7ZTG9_MYTCO|nr:unnamed protein product [Mytilus coruscus]
MNDLDKSQMSDADKVLKWAEAKKLSEATASTLLQLGYDSLEALALLTQDDLSKSKLPIGQQKLLIKSVRQTFLQSEEENDGDLPKRTSMADNNEELPASSSAGAHADINVSSGTNNGLPAPTEPEVTDNYIREVLGQLQKQQPQHGGHVSNCSTNNTASPNNPLYEKAHTQVLNEIGCGNYKFTSSDPCIISPIGVIPKQDGGIRLIHDCSRPKGSLVNSLVSEIKKQRFQTLDDAAKLVTKKFFMSKVDLKSAYRSVKLSQRSQKVTGFNWTFPKGQEFTLYDTKLPFGSKLTPGIFHRLTQAVQRMMSRRGFTVVAYLDDFFLCEQSEFRCRQALNSLIFLLRELGFMINWQKVVDPTTKLTFLGVEIDSIAMELRLPGDKLSLLKQELTDFGNHKRP